MKNAAVIRVDFSRPVDDPIDPIAYLRSEEDIATFLAETAELCSEADVRAALEIADRARAQRGLVR